MSGDVPVDDFRAAMHRAADLVADYLEGVDRYPVLPNIRPGEIAAQLPQEPPLEAEPLDRLLDDYRSLIEPNVTHWNHPGFLGYFSSSGSAPGILGETLAAGLSVNAMLWRTSPAATELEVRTCDWLRRMMDLPDTFRGHINDTASISTLIALAAARHAAPGFEAGTLRRHGLTGLPPLVIYASDQAHSSVDKAAILLGLGHENVHHISSDPVTFRLSSAALDAAIRADRAAGKVPLAVVATMGTTSTASLDPLPEIAAICREQKLWLHVDAAYGGSAAIVPELRPLFDGIESANSIVVNPHKWMFVPMDCSVLFVRDEAQLRDAFSLVPEYLRTTEPGVVNLMDYGVQLGRRFRALKLWMVIRAFGVSGLRDRIRAHCAWTGELAGWIASDPAFEIVSTSPLATVCFRLRTPGDGPAQDRANLRLLARVNAQGPFFITHTALNGRIALHVAIGNLRTERHHVEGLWRALRAEATTALEAPEGEP